MLVPVFFLLLSCWESYVNIIVLVLEISSGVLSVLFNLAGVVLAF
jgi:hypothetical protein